MAERKWDGGQKTLMADLHLFLGLKFYLIGEGGK